jgi:hypothetical protein
MSYGLTSDHKTVRQQRVRGRGLILKKGEEGCHPGGVCLMADDYHGYDGKSRSVMLSYSVVLRAYYPRRGYAVRQYDAGGCFRQLSDGSDSA